MVNVKKQKFETAVFIVCVIFPISGHTCIFFWFSHPDELIDSKKLCNKTKQKSLEVN